MNRALFMLSNMWDVLEQYRKEIIEPYRHRPDAWLNMACHLPVVRGMTTFETRELAFLLDTDRPNLFAELLVEEARFASDLQMIDHRSEVVRRDVWPRLSEAEIPVGGRIETERIEEIIGIATVHELKTITPAIIERVDDAVVALQSRFEHFRQEMKRLYPDQSFINCNFGAAAEGSSVTVSNASGADQVPASAVSPHRRQEQPNAQPSSRI